jgi:hypothetical protein
VKVKVKQVNTVSRASSYPLTASTIPRCRAPKPSTKARCTAMMKTYDLTYLRAPPRCLLKRRLTGRSGSLGRRLEYTDNPRTTAVDRRSTPSARADRQEPLPMFRCPGSPGLSGCRAHLRSRCSPVGCKRTLGWRFIALVVVSFVW